MVVFKKILRMIIFGHDGEILETASLVRASQALDISEVTLRKVIDFQVPLSRQEVDKHAHGKKLKKAFPKAWAEMKEVYGKAYDQLNQKLSSSTCTDHGGPGYIMHLMIGGENANASALAKIFEIKPKDFWQYLKTPGALTAEIVNKLKLRDLLKKHFASGYHQFESEFNQRMAAEHKLAPSGRKRTRSEKAIIKPSEKAAQGTKAPASFGQFLHHMCEMFGSNPSTFSQRLGIPENRYYRIVLDEPIIAQDEVLLKSWPQILETSFPSLWRQIEHDFYFFLNELPLVSNTYHAPRVEPLALWNESAAAFAERLLTLRGDNIVDVLPVFKRPALKSEALWQNILGGDPALSPQIYREAVKELCSIYNIRLGPDSELRPHELVLSPEREALQILKSIPVSGVQKKHSGFTFGDAT